ncbi:lipase [Gordonia crocea]|uniref:Lipase n=1 Tax=Gordonia crocea TaxID=589162 RepID=A0A7M3STZ2_9ACTN|nr:lipase [Gordonia crocea]
MLTSGWLWWAVCLVVFLLVVAVFVLHVTPTPGALLTRRVFDQGSAQMRERNARFAAPDIRVERDIAYLPASSRPAGAAPRDTMLDVYFAPGPPSTTGRPTVVWIHGGGWVSGDKSDPAHYLSRIAARGVTVVSLNYSLAPERTYPLAIAQFNEALRFLVGHAGDYRIDASKLVVAGDSAGANLASQLAAMITNPGFARDVGIRPAIGPERLRGALLNCGVYDAYALFPADQPGSVLARILGWGIDNTLWAYTGSRAVPSPALDQMSTIRHLTPAFPPTWIGAGNADPLTATQSVPLAAKLRAVGVEVTPLIFDESTPERLGHEFQYELGTAAGRAALESSVEFVLRVTR